MTGGSQLRFAPQGSARIAYAAGGDPDGNAAIVLLHDLLGSRADLGPYAAALPAGWRTLLPDLRGHGMSPSLANQQFTLPQLADDVAAVLRAERVERAALLGWGVGGAIAWETARRHPASVTAIVLVDPALSAILDNDPDPAVASLRAARRTTDRAAADDAYRGLTDRALDGYLAAHRGSDWRTHLAAPQLAAIRRHAAALAGLLPALDAARIDRPELREWRIPTLLATSPSASPIDRATVDRLAALLPAPAPPLDGAGPGEIAEWLGRQAGTAPEGR